MNTYQVEYSIGALGYVQVTVQTDITPDHENFNRVVDDLCMAAIIQETQDYGSIRSID